MGQGYSLATLSAGSAGIDIPELADLVYERSLGTSRFMKSIRARHRNGLAIIKVIMKPYPGLKLYPYVEAITRERKILEDVPNALSYQRILETNAGGYLVRQYIHSSLYDRMSTRPFLEDIEKKWISFQLLCALRDCHAKNVYHGDIKTENVLVTSWNWVYLTDFSSSFKPTFLPEDNPADFSFYFDTSGRRTCYLAPERFLGTGEQPGNYGVNWAMDIFSAGCVIAELFLEAPIFTLSQLYKYRKGEYSPEHRLADIADDEVRELILHMVPVDPESRYSAEECLNFWRYKVFPDYFYSFLHQYMSLITDQSSGRTDPDLHPGESGEADERIERIYLDFDKISYFLGANTQSAMDGPQIVSPSLINHLFPLKLDLPTYGAKTKPTKPRSAADNGTLIFLTVLVSSLRNTVKASARVKACDILLAFAEKLPDEAKMDRILPYVLMLLNDPSDTVRVAAIRTLTQLLAMVQVVSPVNAYAFPEYIFPRLQPFIPGPNSNPSPMVRAAYASCIASLAQSSLRVLDMVQALRSDVRLQPLVPGGTEVAWTEDMSYRNLYDVARVDLMEFFEVHAKALLTDSDISVRRAFLGSVSSLCVFFGSPKANEVILSHLNTYLNDRDWILKCAFFEAVVGVAAYVGSTSLEEFILPLMVQSMTDPEEFVVERALRSLGSMAKLGLFQRWTTWDLLHIAVRFCVHPSIWVREAAVRFIVASTTFLSAADKHSIITPLIRPFLKTSIIEISECQILDALKKPLPRTLYDMLLVWATKSSRGIFWKSAARDGVFTLTGPTGFNIGKLRQRSSNLLLSSAPKNDEDEQWLSRLRNLGLAQEEEFKLMALKEYIWKVASRRMKDHKDDTTSPFSDIIPLSQHNVTPQTIFFDKKQGVKQHRTSPQGTRPSTSDSRPHTIADALLDASTTIDFGPDARRKHARSRSQRLQRDNAPPSPISRKQTTESGRVASPQGASPLSSSPGTQLNTPIPPSESGRKDFVDRDHRDTASLDRDDSSTHRDPDKRSLVPPKDVKHRSSAINLLGRQENSKAYAEIATTSTNVFGELDVRVQKDTYEPLDSPAITEGSSNNATELSRPRYRANHTYTGNDPTILKLLDTVFAKQYPVDLFDFGPIISPTSRGPIKKASGEVLNTPWRPQGNLVAMFGEHTGPVNRVVVAPDHAFFVTASDDGTVKVWDTTRLEKNLTPRSRQTHRHAPGTKVKTLTFVEHTHTFISAATDGSVHAVRIDYQVSGGIPRYGKPQVVRQYQIPSTAGVDEYAVWIEHYRTETHSTLLMATNRSRLIGLDLKSMDIIYILENPVHHGTPTTFCLDRKRNWVLVGTTHGILDLWDLRFGVRMKAWGLPGGTPIHRLLLHPLKGRGRWVCAAGGSHSGSEIMVWDIDKVQCREVYRLCSVAGDANHAATAHKTERFTADTSWKNYEPWWVDEENPAGVLGRFAANTGGVEPSVGSASHSTQSGGASDRNGICALAVGLDIPAEGQEGPKCGFLISGGSDHKLRFWDVTHPDVSGVFSGVDVSFESVVSKPRYIISSPTPSLTVTTEWSPAKNSAGTSSKKSSGRSGGGTSGGSRPSRSTVISLQQQQLLRSHLEMILDVAILESPYGMTVSVDRAGMIYVFQ
ncbi:hypothetical protein VTO42DRAFT_8539 [Malbranchea cinnamomea]